MEKESGTVQEEKRPKQESTARGELNATGGRGAASYIVNLFTIIEPLHPTDQALLATVLVNRNA